MNLTSPVFKNLKQIPTRYTCDGENIHPPLEISERPKYTKSFCIIMEDLDASDGVWNWLHWTIWNISPDTKIINAGRVPVGSMQGKNTTGLYHYVGPCPPKGVHRYRFSLYALSKEIDINPDCNVEDLKEEMNGHILAETELIGTYDRNGTGEFKKKVEEKLAKPLPKELILPQTFPLLGYTEGL